MSSSVAEADSSACDTLSRPRTIYRHMLPIRIMHWINFLCMFILLLSGFQIFNAHAALYWGETSHFDSPLLAMDARRNNEGEMVGVTTLFGHEFETTGFLGASPGGRGDLERRAFPTWLTIPGPRWLAMGRRWHFFFAWLFVINGLLYVAYSLWTRHASRDLIPTRADWRGIGRSIVDHALLRHPRGEAAARYNILQKLSYLFVIWVLGPLVVLMGLAMSPHMDTVLGWMVDLVGGRQSARTIHFIIAMALIAFFFVHVFEVIVTGLANNMRSMITGHYKIKPTEDSSDVRD